MILKIKEGNEFWMFDNLEKVHYGYAYDGRVTVSKDCVTYHNTKVPFSPDVFIIDWERVNESKDDPVGLHWVCARDKNDNERFFVFNTEGYICNDNGKTLEVIR